MSIGSIGAVDFGKKPQVKFGGETTGALASAGEKPMKKPEPPAFQFGETTGALASGQGNNFLAFA